MTPRGSYLQAIVLGVVLAAFLIGAVTYGVHVWSELGDTPMSPSGFVALVIGALAATAVGVGLMGLVFYSNRHGIDDDVANPLDGDALPDKPRGK